MRVRRAVTSRPQARWREARLVALHVVHYPYASGYGLAAAIPTEDLDIARARIKHAAPGQPVEGGRDHEPEGPWQPGLF